MKTYEIYGDFNNNLSDSNQILVISFSLSSIPFKQRWRNNSLSANFIADYLTAFFSVEKNDAKTVARKKELQASVSYITNELLENAMKFHDDRTKNPIRFGVHLLEDIVVLLVSNCVSSEIWLKFYPIINDLMTCDLEDLYIDQVKKLAEDENNQVSGLGLITIMSDYSATLGWKINKIKDDNGLITIRTMAQFKV
ncbi:slr1658 superfamily regulator [Dapis sp. BLCC M126]|uniref:slr1658 superfamily regulator n=1 Tax=Dapis sp. BLCC M126 TaxID=3400189 RepID=UPI003CF4B17A